MMEFLYHLRMTTYCAFHHPVSFVPTYLIKKSKYEKKMASFLCFGTTHDKNNNYGITMEPSITLASYRHYGLEILSPAPSHIQVNTVIYRFNIFKLYTFHCCLLIKAQVFLKYLILIQMPLNCPSSPDRSLF